MRHACVIGILALPGLFAFSPGNLGWLLSLSAFAYALFTIVPFIGNYAFDRINGE